MESLKQEIFAFIESTGEVSFVELHETFGEVFEGEYTMFSSPRSKIVLWSEISAPFIDAIRELLFEGKIGMRYSADALSAYTERGVVLPYPVAENPTRDIYRDYHWLPVVMSATSE
ncbi:hypothetical protein FGU65_02105 [Methanoculleus sp. FWC-SCC1]|uniref:Uncharacterized protein n=1 Tax=Methanoculleus frigidifontis TaxID=2584085 RepID=A0ABT8M6Y8_9EURY|nr:hypothetical protein [Methanoculleus sp. FWC-SCC1]MDN7023700.1 hypothetical protein [Methanoculleus sp. FWC-SCC1]